MRFDMRDTVFRYCNDERHRFAADLAIFNVLLMVDGTINHDFEGLGTERTLDDNHLFNIHDAPP
jgi:hypothetical protein